MLKSVTNLSNLTFLESTDTHPACQASDTQRSAGRDATREGILMFSCFIFCHQLVSGAKPRTPKGSSRTAQGASPGFKVQIAESPERAAQGVRYQLQINARHKAPLWYRDQLHRPFGASVVTVLVPRACALGFPESPLRG